MQKKKSKNKDMLKYYTKERLMQVIDEECGLTLAHKLAREGDWYTNDKEILMLQSKGGFTVAYFLIIFNDKWKTYNREILSILNKNDNTTVAYMLALTNPDWFTFDKDLLLLEHQCIPETIAQVFAADDPKWCCYNIDILHAKNIRKILLMQKKYIATRVKKNVVTIVPII